MNGKDILKALVHSSAFFAPFLFPFIVWMIADDQDLKLTSRHALLFHLTISICVFFSWVFSFILIGIPFLIFFGIVGVYYPIKGIVYSLTNKRFQYPLIK
jgi:uncharacterized protein